MKDPSRKFVWLLVAGVSASILLFPRDASPAGRGDAFRGSGFNGSGASVMQSVTVPGRIGQVAVVPGSDVGEVWGVGQSDAKLPGWGIDSRGGQTVFLRYRRSSGWQLIGPPRGADGKVINPGLYSFSMARSGEGWAVGEGGIFLHKTRGSQTWAEVPEAGAAAGRGSADVPQLNSVSVVQKGDVLGGYSVGTIMGAGGTSESLIMRYVGGRWQREDLAASPDLVADGRPELLAVSTVSADEAWAVTGSSSTALRVYRRSNNSWRRVAVDTSPEYPVFSGPHPSRMRNGGFNFAAFGGAIAANEDGAWVGGRMFPRDSLHPSGDDLGGEKSRPFAIRLRADGGPTTYCPDKYSLGSQAGGSVDPEVICDRPFPFSIYDVTSISLLPGGEVFAGGMGLYHFKDGAWIREPDTTGYLASVSFASPSEGWVATTGNTFGAGGVIGSSENIVGHWTSDPSPSSVSRWPQSQFQPLHGLAIAPDGSGRAIAVGEDGASVAYAPEFGWDSLPSSSFSSVHAVGWADPTTAWSVGERGLIQKLNGSRWGQAPESENLTTSSLFDVTFAKPNDGVAVGTQGTILRFDGSSWTRDPASGKLTREKLYSVASLGDSMIAVGTGGTLLERIGGVWRRNASIAALLPTLPNGPAALFAVATAQDGTVIAGGARSTLIIRRPGKQFETMRPTLEGNITSLAAKIDLGGDLRVYAAVDPQRSGDFEKYRGDKMFSTRTSVMSLEGSTWRDLSLSRARTLYVSTDSTAYVDPVYDIALDSAHEGWAVGGFPAGQPGEEHPLRVVPTSSVYRLDTTGDPSFPFSRSPVSFPKKGVNLAFLSETWCDRGLCSMTMGSGTQADSVALAIQNEVNYASKLPSGPAFVLFGGGGRGGGIPEELGELWGFLQRFERPVFGAIGSRDLFGGINDTFLGELISQTEDVTQSPSAGVPTHWKSLFSAAPRPWGESPPIPGFDPVELPTSPAADPSARTHYAFDYTPRGRKLFRIVVIDSSTKSFGNLSDQNPRENQGEWVNAVMADAMSQALPILVVMNQPTMVPDRTPQINWTGRPTDKGILDSAATTNGVSAILTGGARWSVKDGIPSVEAPVVPIYIMGTGGAPLGYDKPSAAAQDPSKLSTDGYYNAWFLVNIDPEKRPALGLPNQVAVTVKPFPILEYLAMRALDGRAQAAGNVLRFAALGRSLTGGGADPEQSRATYVPVGFNTLPECFDAGQGYGTCSARYAMRPPYRFWSENPDIADFVEPDFGLGDSVPKWNVGADGKKSSIVKDATGQFGLLCTFKAGSTFINVESGFHRARTKVSVGGGFGPCVKEPVPGPVFRDPLAPPAPELAPELARPFLRPPNPPIEVTGYVLPPPPAPVVAPAPPASAAGARQEKKEAQYQQEGQEDDDDASAEFRALQHRPRNQFTPQAGWMLAGSSALVGLLFAALAGGVIGRRQRPAFVWAGEKADQS